MPSMPAPPWLTPTLTDGSPSGGEQPDPALDFFRNWMAQHGIPGSWGNAEDALPAYQQGLQQGLSPEEAQQYALRYLGWDKGGPQAPPAPEPAPAPASFGGMVGGSLIDPFTQSFTPPTPKSGVPSYIPQTPEFKPPGYTPPPAWSYQDFVAPTAQDVLGEPGYQFGLDQSEQGLQNARAAQGILGTGGTLKEIMKLAGDYATQRYQGAFDRKLTGYQTNRANSLDAYNTNYQTQYADPYRIAYMGATDAFAPKMTAYGTQAAAGQHQNDLDYANAWNAFLFDYNKYRNQKLDTFNMQWPVASA